MDSARTFLPSVAEGAGNRVAGYSTLTMDPGAAGGSTAESGPWPSPTRPAWSCRPGWQPTAASKERGLTRRYFPSAPGNAAPTGEAATARSRLVDAMDDQAARLSHQFGFTATPRLMRPYRRMKDVRPGLP